MQAVPYVFADAVASTIVNLSNFIPMTYKAQSREFRTWKAAFLDHINNRWKLRLEIAFDEEACEYRFMKEFTRYKDVRYPVRFEDVQKMPLKYLRMDVIRCGAVIPAFKASKDEISAIFKFIRPLLSGGVTLVSKDKRSREDYVKFVMKYYRNK